MGLKKKSAYPNIKQVHVLIPGITYGIDVNATKAEHFLFKGRYMGYKKGKNEITHLFSNEEQDLLISQTRLFMHSTVAFCKDTAPFENLSK